MLTDVGQKLYSRDRKGECPGVARVRFFAKDTFDYAIILSKKEGPSYRSNVLLAKETAAHSWKLITLEADIQDAPPAVLTLPPGKYTGESEEERPLTLESPNEVVLLIGYESWSIVYATTANGVEKVWLSD